MAKPELTRTYATFEDACRDQDERSIAAQLPNVIHKFEALLKSVAEAQS